jgi:hypothetical protein
MIKSQESHVLKNTYFKHEATGRVFKLLAVTNEHARASKRDKWPIMAIYVDGYGGSWAAPLIQFEDSLLEIQGEAPKVPVVTKEFYLHAKTGKIFELVCFANTRVKFFKRKKWPATAVYKDDKGKFWSCRIREFHKKLLPIKY